MVLLSYLPSPVVFAQSSGNLVDKVDEAIIYHDASNFEILGTLPGNMSFTRLPPEAEKEVRPAVWGLSGNTSGIAIRFRTNSSTIKVRWHLTNNRVKSNMTPIASKGLDLYAFTGNRWQFVGVALPGGDATNQATIIAAMEKQPREYLLNLPLYDGVKMLEIGTDHDAIITLPEVNIIDRKHPILFYGTSITQGASASRPGLTYPALLQRRLNKAVINLGFSGNGRFEKEVLQFATPARPAIIILDCTPNSAPDTILKNLPESLAYIKSINDSVPVVLVESIVRDYAYFRKDDSSKFGTLSYIQEQNNALRKVYMDHKDQYKNLYYIFSKELIGEDHEATVDGTHFNDLGNFRMYENLLPIIERIMLR
jgi:lysophospholipase L1-like esterase